MKPQVTRVELEIMFQLIFIHRVDPKPSPTPGQLGDGELLLDWLVGPAGSKGYAMVRPHEACSYGEAWPDLCIECGYQFGNTVGGRVRNGCPVCRGDLGGHPGFLWARYSGTNLESRYFFEVATKYLYRKRKHYD